MVAGRHWLDFDGKIVTAIVWLDIFYTNGLLSSRSTTLVGSLSIGRSWRGECFGPVAL
jgi:hypothetical protein